MTLAVGWSHADVEEEPGIQYTAGCALEDKEWSTPQNPVTCGRLDVKGAAVKTMRLWTRGNPGAGIGTKAASWSEQGWDVAILNEPNLNVRPEVDVEKFRGGPDEHGQYVLDAIAVAGPNHRIGFTPMSPGVGLDVVRTWLSGAITERAIRACRVVFAHVYGDAERMWADLQPVLEAARKAGKKVIITECSIAAGQNVEAWGAEELPTFLAKVAAEAPDVLGVCVFAPSWPKPDGATTEPLRLLGTAAHRSITKWVATHPYTEEPTVPDVTLGTDISNNQGEVDLAKMRAGGYEFTFIKASGDEGGGDNVFLDRFFPENWHAANANEMVRGAYHYARPSVKSPAESVTTFQRAIQAVGGLKAGDHIALDVEDPAVTDGTSLHVWVAEWLSLAEQVLGVTPFKYSARYYTSTHDLEHADLERFPTWWASYQDTLPPACTGWKPITIWQNGVIPGVPGVQGDCDVNKLYGTAESLRAMGYQGTAAPDEPVSPDPAPEDVETTASLDALWSLTEGLVQAGQEAQAIEFQKAIARLKRSIGRE